MREQLIEIWTSMRNNKLRTILTGFSVAWGIFILVVLLGAGNGLKNGISSNFSNMAVNSMNLYDGYTSKPYAGYAQDRHIRLSNKDLSILADEFDEIKEVGAYAWFRSQTLTYKGEFQSVAFDGVTPEMQRMDGIEMLEGRFINPNDMSEKRKVAVVDNNIVKILFKGQSPIGKKVECTTGQYTVIGVFKSEQFNNEAQAYIPLSTAQLIFAGGSNDIASSMFTIEGIQSIKESEQLEDRIRQRLSAEHSFAPDDNRAIWISNNFEDFKQISKVFKGIDIFLWVIGLGTLMAGIVGVGNIMLVTVRERTYEFGLRKAIGARPRSIITLILLESIIVTALFGYIGMVAGVGTMEVVNHVVESAAQSAQSGSINISIFKDPTLNLSITVSATIVLIVAGLVAGYIPARRAARLKTVDALRFNK